jgi:hypothetical protein
MIYAATKATLLNHLGYQFFSEELHANDEVRKASCNAAG